ncbi:hypothetical protein A0L26_01890 [Campylobacter jejuni]|nr:hypothetical protein A0L21_07805 [Campylobacter jejuni]OEY51186.1 hypothetical protein A0L26_01890 [Campylobacter jejuni]OKY18656.1 hypothetical protein A0L42_07435 [Campylobacter jejuni]
MTVRKENTTAGEAPPGAGLLDTLSRGHFGTKRPEAAGSVPTPEHAAGMGQETFSGRTAMESKMEGTHER